jgi:uncharacterized linocin/CFP29 family protein
VVVLEEEAADRVVEVGGNGESGVQGMRAVAANEMVKWQDHGVYLRKIVGTISRQRHCP